LIAKLVIN